MKIPRTKSYSVYKNLVLQNERSQKLNFDIDGREHYVYRVTDGETGEYYYGSHTPAKGKIYNSLKEEFFTYGTSGKRKKLILKCKMDRYYVKILKVFNNAADKIIYESFLHQYFNVRDHNKFWNDNNQTPFKFLISNKIRIDNGKKISKTKANPIWKEKNRESFKRGKVKELKTKSSFIWKNTVQKEQIRKYKEWYYTGNNAEIRNNKISKTLLSEEWAEKNLPKKIILDENGNKVFEFHIKVKRFCERYGLPHRAFERALKSGKTIYGKYRNSKTKEEHYLKYKDWKIKYEN